MTKKQQKQPRICDICGKQFIPKVSKSVTCSDPECQAKKKRIREAEYRRQQKVTDRINEKYYKTCSCGRQYYGAADTCYDCRGIIKENLLISSRRVIWRA